MSLYNKLETLHGKKLSPTLKYLVNHIHSGCCYPWPFCKDSDGYPAQVRIGKKLYRITRLVCELVNGPPPSKKHHARHKCGKAGCFNGKCIVWGTAKENEADKVIHGTKVVGSRCGRSRLTKRSVLFIRVSKWPKKDLAEKFGVSLQTIQDIQYKKTWQWL